MLEQGKQRGAELEDVRAKDSDNCVRPLFRYCLINTVLFIYENLSVSDDNNTSWFIAESASETYVGGFE